MTQPTSLPTPDLMQLAAMMQGQAAEPTVPEVRPKPKKILSKEEQAALADWIREEFKRCKTARSSVERQWQINMAFYYGRQNVSWIPTATSATGYALQVPKAPPWRVRLIVNKIRPIIRTEVAKMVAQKPRFTVVPASTEDQDTIAARVSEQVFDSVYETQKVKRVLRRMAWWASVTGTGYIKCYWDSEKPDNDSKQRGNFCIEPVTPFHVFVPDLREEELENQPFLIHASTKSMDYVHRTYGKKINGRTIEPNAKAADDILEDSFLNLVGAQHRKSDQVLCLEVWIKPGGHKKFPKGGLVTLLGDEIVQVIDEFPYEHGEYPFAKTDHIPSGKFYGSSIVEDLIPLQREYNRTRSQIIEAKNRMAKPQLIAPKGSVDPNKITTEPGQVILYTPGFNPPQPLQMQALPAYVSEELARAQQDMDDIAGQHEISRGKNPSQVTAATALSFLQEQDDTKLSSTIESIEQAVEKVGRLVLGYVKQFWDTPRLVKVVGSDSQFEAKKYKGEDLGGNLDVRVEAGSALPQSKAAKQAFLMDLMKLGLIPPEKGLEMLGLGGIEKVYEEVLIDTRQAQRENQRMSEGEQIPCNTWDNHELHVQVHDKFRKSQQFEALDDNVKAIFEAHVQTHQQVLADQAPPTDEQGNPVQDPGAPQESPVGNPAAPMPPQ